MDNPKQSNTPKHAKDHNAAPRTKSTLADRELRLSDAAREDAIVRILDGIATTTKGLAAICADLNTVTRRTFLRWVSEDYSLRHRYAHAREFQQELLAEEILAISDDGSNDTYVDEEGRTRVDHDNIQRSRLRVETRKRLMSKLAPKKYGDKSAMELSGEIKNTGAITAPEELVAEVKRRLPGFLAAISKVGGTPPIPPVSQ